MTDLIFDNASARPATRSQIRPSLYTNEFVGKLKLTRCRMGKR